MTLVLTMSSSRQPFAYKAGEFDETLLSVLRNYEKVINVILPTLGEERRKTYSPSYPSVRKRASSCKCR